MSKSKRKKRHTHRKRSQGNLIFYVGGLMVVALILTGAWLLNQSNAGITELAAEINVREAAHLREAGVFILDVRQPEEWRQYHIPGSTLIPLDQLASRLDEIPKRKAIVVVCREGNRSLDGRDILLNAGYEVVTSMAGGLRQWHGAGYPLVAGD